MSSSKSACSMFLEAKTTVKGLWVLQKETKQAGILKKSRIKVNLSTNSKTEESLIELQQERRAYFSTDTSEDNLNSSFYEEVVKKLQLKH
ncbi:hypothetical protein Tco_0466311 [Tanacetum coccineum]